MAIPTIEAFDDKKTVNVDPTSKKSEIKNDSKERNVTDFLLGLFGVAGVHSLLSAVLGFVIYGFLSYFFFDLLIIVGCIIIFILGLVNKRKWLSIGVAIYGGIMVLLVLFSFFVGYGGFF